ncbi:hypothetical protein [Brucella pseudogrignonensis]|uniref:hypothetical protein n=1 Tax=Brucella pseudogrignonensis TaxID=419475 RepID=UPI003D96A144
MMIVDKSFRNFQSAIFVFATIGVLSGCTTTTKQIMPCNTQQVAKLSKVLDPTKLKLNAIQKRLSAVRVERAQERCNESLFSPEKGSVTCVRLKKQEKQLVSEKYLLEERLTEINAAIASQPHAGKHVKSCVASWQPERTIRKRARKNIEVKIHSAKRQAAKTTGREKLSNDQPVFIEDYVVPAYSSQKTNETESVAYTPSAHPLSQQPSHVAPAAIAPPTERAYSDSTKVRVVGSSFFPDQSKLIGPPAPDHAPAP